MVTAALPRLTALKYEVDTSLDAFGELRRSDHLIGNAPALRERMEEDGYIFLPGLLDREAVRGARRSIMEMLADEGLLEPGTSSEDGIAAREPRTKGLGVRNDLAKRSAELQRLLYAGRMMAFYRHFLGGDVLHFTYTWLRPRAPGGATPPHYDIVFMGRGTTRLCTAWTPLSDISYEMGGLMVLEGSHRLEGLKNTYGQKDVDTYCTNLPHAQERVAGNKLFTGQLSRNPIKLRNTLGGRWLTAEFRMGDVLTFGMYTLHCSLDNQSDRVRLSCDTRYQLASEPADHRWVGEEPPGHGVAIRQGHIC
ncbi:MAG: phytanoyl-CoA dioxygenase family protein [Chloroflexi bacterium]|nr:phytanoyl-CoA dioxygenase family protein [Chloroflexota bacterium]